MNDCQITDIIVSLVFKYSACHKKLVVKMEWLENLNVLLQLQFDV